MLCSRCYKEIPSGKEVQKASGNFWRTSWGNWGGGSEIFCYRCARKIDKQAEKDRKVILYFLLFLLFLRSLSLLA